MSHLIGKPSPVFQAPAALNGQILENFSLTQYLGQYVVFFFYPLDFTFVCPTELHAFAQSLEEFEKRNCQVVACSVDSVHTHLAYLRTPKSQGGIEGVDYPIVSDLKKHIAQDYGVLCQEEGIAYRGLFLIDQQGVIRHQLINDLPIGRSVDEALRVLDALIFTETYGQVCPANWNRETKGIDASTQSVSEYLASH